MLRLPSQQGVKALCKCLRNPPRNPLHARYVHSEQAPYSGPPGWATISRRLSSRPSPLIYFANMRDEEARERNEFIDIHDIGGVDPNTYDVLLSDINDNMYDLMLRKCDLCNQHIPYWEVDSIGGSVKWYIGKKLWQITPKNP
ncbi:hypothetical protein OIDMADRAFT_60070 [Oidiodendron maius Zn]|uniref:Uncharacterized protein n=1 Tax=Oidiodendron maius (strain Zn) TaxID=913774 RepID=A0A0C3GX90_OIDMZ|nr:hypothetical protein OIDMADRAFT_60070 [Oidiodendron maius Zn]